MQSSIRQATVQDRVVRREGRITSQWKREEGKERSNRVDSHKDDIAPDWSERQVHDDQDMHKRLRQTGKNNLAPCSLKWLVVVDQTAANPRL